MKGKNYSYAVTLHLVRDPGVSDGDLARSLADWKRLKDSGRSPPDWGQEPDGTLRGFLRMLTRSGKSDYMKEAAVVRRGGGTMLDCVNVFYAPARWMDILAQALSAMAYGLRPRTYLNISRVGLHTSKPGVFRRFEIVLNGDGEPEVEEVDPEEDMEDDR